MFLSLSSRTRLVTPALALTPMLALFLTVAACSGDTPAPAAKPADKPVQAPVTTAAAPPPTLAMSDLAAEAQNVTLAPSPAEMQKAMEKAGISGGLSKLVQDRDLKLDVSNKDVVAVRTGVVLADCLLTVKEATKEKLVARLALVKTGMNTLGAGKDLPATIDDLTARINNDSISRDDLVKELDEMHGAIIPEIQFEAGDRSVPLIQAGSWLEGSNLVAAAIVAANKPDAGTQMLRQPEVVGYFLKYVKTEGADKASSGVITQLQGTLEKLQEIAAKPALTLDDVKEIKAQTDSVLTLL